MTRILSEDEYRNELLAAGHTEMEAEALIKIKRVTVEASDKAFFDALDKASKETAERHAIPDRILPGAIDRLRDNIEKYGITKDLIGIDDRTMPVLLRPIIDRDFAGVDPIPMVLTHSEPKTVSMGCTVAPAVCSICNERLDNDIGCDHVPLNKNNDMFIGTHYDGFLYVSHDDDPRPFLQLEDGIAQAIQKEPDLIPDIETDALILAIAIACHNANKKHCESVGDNSQESWSATPENIRASAIDGVSKWWIGDILTPEQSHESWMAFKKADGWVYGETKDLLMKKHPCMVPYGDLPEEQRVKDDIFMSTVHTCMDAFGVQRPS